MWQRGNELLHPEQILDRLGVRSGWHVGDVGCGTIGHFTFPTARRVGGSGKVYAIDIQRSALRSLEKSARGAQLWNVYPVWGDAERAGGISVPAGSLDLTFLINTLYLARNRAAMLEEALRLTRPGGFLAVIEWLKEPSVLGPAFEDRVSQDELYTHLQDQPLAWMDRFSAGRHHQGYLFQKQQEDEEPVVLSFS